MDDELLFRSLCGRTDASEEALLRVWRQADPANEDHYRRVAAIASAAERADAARALAPAPTLRELIGAPEAVPAPSHRRQWATRLVAAAAVLAVGFAASELRPRPLPAGFGAEEFVTGPNETATVSLRDGSVVRLAPKSRLRLAGQSGGREVTLTGRAYFAVAKQHGRPFRIKTSAGDVTVLGTRFALEAESEDLKLVVVEGKVALSARGTETQVSAGEMGRVVKGTTLPVSPTVDPGPMVGWVGNFLAFQATPLGDAAKEIERQFNVRVMVADSSLSRRTISGWFAGWSVDEVMDVVCVIASATCSRAGDVVTMRPR